MSKAFWLGNGMVALAVVGGVMLAGPDEVTPAAPTPTVTVTSTQHAVVPGPQVPAHADKGLNALAQLREESAQEEAAAAAKQQACEQSSDLLLQSMEAGRMAAEANHEANNMDGDLNAMWDARDKATDLQSMSIKLNEQGQQALAQCRS